MEEITQPISSSRSKEDRALIEAAKEGDDKAFQKLMKKYRKSVYYLIFKMVRNPEDAEDLTQESFIKAFASLNKFDPRFAFSTWLFKISTNNSIDFIRRKKMQTLSINVPTTMSEDGSGVLYQIIDTALIPYESMLRNERKELLNNAITQLPERYQLLIQLRYFKEYSYEEVAEELKIPLGTVKAQLHRAKELLNAHLINLVSNS